MTCKYQKKNNEKYGKISLPILTQERSDCFHAAVVDLVVRERCDVLPERLDVVADLEVAASAERPPEGPLEDVHPRVGVLGVGPQELQRHAGFLTERVRVLVPCHW